MITLDTLRLPDGLRWTDEFAWSPVAQSSAFGLTGALLIQQGIKQAGRPVTLTGGNTWAWMRRSALIALQALIDGATTPLILTLHDGRAFHVLPDQTTSAGALVADALPIVLDSGPADPQPESWYVVNTLKFVVVA